MVNHEVVANRRQGRLIGSADYRAALGWTQLGYIYSDIFSGPGVHRDVVVRGGKVAPARARFQPALPRAGRYQVCLGFRPSKSQDTNTPVTIRDADGTMKLTVNQRRESTPFNFVPLGEFQFRAGDSCVVEVTNANTDGRIAIDGVCRLWLNE